MTAAKVSHRILRLEVIGPDGTRSTDHRVFCQLQHRSIRVETCCSCFHCDEVTSGAEPSVDCTIPVAPREPADDPSGELIEVGTLLTGPTVVVSRGATIGHALGVLRNEDRRAVGIVDDEGILVGLVHEARFMGHRRGGRDGVVSAAMSTAIAIHESTPVRTALKLLAANHLREATVVTDEGIPLGVFRDVDGLQFIVSARGASVRPPPDSGGAGGGDHG